MALMEWSDSFIVGIPEMDQQHMYLIELINQLDDAARISIEHQAIPKTLAELVAFIKYHIGEEEELMNQYDYPVMDDHAAAHKELLISLMDILKSVQSGELSTLSNLAIYLQIWLEKHIVGFDQDYGRFVNRRKAAGSVKVTYI